MRISGPVPAGRLAGFAGLSHRSTRLSTAVDNLFGARAGVAFSTAFPSRGACGQRCRGTVRLYSPAAGSMWPHLFHGTHETDLSAERTQAGEEARLPQPHVDPCRPHDPEAPSRQGPQAPLGVGPLQRRNRLSRSRDFDAVYRQGRSASTRFLTLYWFQRDETVGDPRLGFAVPKSVGSAPVRNRIKRQLREVWRERLEQVPAGRDYVLIAKPGLPEAVTANGFEWLAERVDEVLTKAAA